MSTFNHSPIPYPGDGAGGTKQPANAAIINSPLGELDAKMGDLSNLSALSTSSLVAAILAQYSAWNQADDALDDRIDTIIAGSETSSTETVDARTAINYGTAPATLALALEYAAQDVYNVLAYGATGDGATDDTTAIQAAIDAASAAGGGIVFFPRGVYLIDFVTLKNDCIYAGAGTGATIIRKRSSSPTSARGLFHMAASADIENIVIQDMSFEQLQAVAARCIWLRTSSNDIYNLTIQRVYAKCDKDIASANAIQIGGGGAGARCFGVRILNNKIESAANAVNNCMALYISHDAITAGYDSLLIVAGNEIVGGREGYNQGDSGTANVLYFTNNLVHGQTNRGGHFYHGIYSRIIGNHFHNITALPSPGAAGAAHDSGAVWFDVAAPDTGNRTAEFSSNIIRDCVGNGLFVEEARGCVISNNTIVKNTKRVSSISAITGDGATVTVTVGNANYFVINATVRIAGTSSYDGDFVITAVNVGAGTITYADTATGAEATGTATCVFIDPVYSLNDSEGGHGILVTGSCSGLMIKNNRIEANGNAGILGCREFGPHYDVSSGSIIIDGNYINENGAHGVWLDGANVVVGNWWRLVHNNIFNNGGGASPYAGVFSESNASAGQHMILMDNNIAGNYHGFYHDNQMSNVYMVANFIQADNAGYAVFHGNPDQIVLVANQIHDGLVDTNLTVNSNRIKAYANTIEYITDRREKVSAANLDANGEYTFSHFLAAEPAYVGLTFLGDQTRDIQLIAVTSTQITVRVYTISDGADYTGSVDFYWEARM